MNCWASLGLLAVAACGGGAQEPASEQGLLEPLPQSSLGGEAADPSAGAGGQREPRAPERPPEADAPSSRAPIPSTARLRRLGLDVCTAGSTRCNGANAEVCAAADGLATQWLISQQCECGCRTQLGLSFCQAEGSCPHLDCAIGALRCSGDTLERCADGFAWERVERCSGACNLEPSRCVADAGAPAL